MYILKRGNRVYFPNLYIEKRKKRLKYYVYIENGIHSCQSINTINIRPRPKPKSQNINENILKQKLVSIHI